MMSGGTLAWTVVVAMRQRVLLTEHEKKHLAHILVDYELSPQERMPVDYLNPVKSLWADSGIQQAIAKGNEYALHDNLT